MRKFGPLLAAASLFFPVMVLAQQVAVGDPGPAAHSPPSGPGFLTTISDPGPISTLIWLGIILLALASLPLGILSIIHCAKAQTLQWPLSTKLLICGGAWVFVVGLFGAVHGGIIAFATLACTTAGAAQKAMLSINIAESLYSIAAALIAVQLYLVFFMISMIIIHFKHRKNSVEQAF